MKPRLTSAEKVACPECGAPPGQRCFTRNAAWRSCLGRWKIAPMSAEKGRLTPAFASGFEERGGISAGFPRDNAARQKLKDGAGDGRSISFPPGEVRRTIEAVTK